MTSRPRAGPPETRVRAAKATVVTCLVVAASMTLAAVAAVAVFWYFVFVPCTEGMNF